MGFAAKFDGSPGQSSASGAGGLWPRLECGRCVLYTADRDWRTNCLGHSKIALGVDTPVMLDAVKSLRVVGAVVIASKCEKGFHR